MLTKDQKRYLSKIPKDKKVSIKPYDSKARKVGNNIISAIKKRFPDLDIFMMGSVVLEIAGQNDLDIYILSHSKNFDKYMPSIKKLFGDPLGVHEDFIEWSFEEDGYDVELYLTEPPLEQIEVFKALDNNKDLLKEYENLKLKYDNKPLKEYQKAKFEFFNDILNK